MSNKRVVYGGKAYNCTFNKKNRPIAKKNKKIVIAKK